MSVRVIREFRSRLELESRLQDIERKRIGEETERHNLREKVDERVRVVEELRETAEKETISLR